MNRIKLQKHSETILPDVFDHSGLALRPEMDEFIRGTHASEVCYARMLAQMRDSR
jgi:hypothetical protein